LRHFLTVQGITHERFEALLARSEEFRRGEQSAALSGKHVGLVFFNPSLRTRVSMEVAVSLLGGTPVTLSVGGDAWPMEYADGVVMDGAAAEHVREGAGALGRYCDFLGVRAFPAGKDYAVDRHEPVLMGFVQHAGVPVVNLESTLGHPCQAMADAMTLKQRFGLVKGRRILLTWAWHPKALPMAVPSSFLQVASRLGADVVLARPEGYDLDGDVLRAAEQNALQAGGSVTVTPDLESAYDGVEAVYAKSWGSLADYGQPGREAARRGRYRDWRVTEARMARGKDAIFMHCLPVRRNVVVDDAVLDGPRSVVLDQAENRLYTQQAILEWLAKENE
jgi:N-acetylornithine carbamoyltransferase